MLTAKRSRQTAFPPVYYSGVDTWTLQFFALMGWYSDYAPEDAQAFADAMSTNQKHWSDMNGFIDSIGKIKELVDLGYVQETLPVRYLSAGAAGTA